MLPLLPPGSRVVAVPVKPESVLQAGDIVAARRPDRPSVEIIKRIHSLVAPGQYFLTGDNPDESTDSRHFGPVSVDQITALIRWRYWPLPPRRLS